MTTEEMRRATHKPGYWWVNTAPLGKSPNWQEQVAPIDARGTLFGYPEREFMAKQYRA